MTKVRFVKQSSVGSRSMQSHSSSQFSIKPLEKEFKIVDWHWPPEAEIRAKTVY